MTHPGTPHAARRSCLPACATALAVACMHAAWSPGLPAPWLYL